MAKSKKQATKKAAKKSNGAFRPEQKIVVLAKENPRQKGSTGYKSFELYRKCRTVGAYLKHGKPNAHAGHLRWDLARNFIKLS